MPTIKLIADSGSTKTEWCLLNRNRKKLFLTQGLSPYFVSSVEMENILNKHVLSVTGKSDVAEIYFYGTGCKNPGNIKMVKKAINAVFPKALISVDNDLSGAAKALCGSEKGIACILGTGSNSCYFNGKTNCEKQPWYWLHSWRRGEWRLSWQKSNSAFSIQYF